LAHGHRFSYRFLYYSSVSLIDNTANVSIGNTVGGSFRIPAMKQRSWLTTDLQEGVQAPNTAGLPEDTVGLSAVAIDQGLLGARELAEGAYAAHSAGQTPRDEPGAGQIIKLFQSSMAETKGFEPLIRLWSV
jgi:hypothetical protein